MKSARRAMAISVALAALFIGAVLHPSVIPSKVLFCFYLAFAVLAPGLLIARILIPSVRGVILASCAFALGAAFTMTILMILSLIRADITLLRVIMPISVIALSILPCKKQNEGENIAGTACMRGDNPRGTSNTIAFTNTPYIEGENRFAASILLILIVATCAFVWITGDPFLYTSDSADHVAYIRTVARTHEAFPERFYYPNPGTLTKDIRKGMAHALWGTIAAMSGEKDMEFVWKVISLVGTIFYIAAIYSAGILIFESAWIGLAGALLAVFLGDGGFAKNTLAQIGGGYLFGRIFYLSALACTLLYLKSGKKSMLALSVAAALAATYAHIAHLAIYIFAISVMGLCSLAGLCTLSEETNALKRAFRAISWTIILAAPYLAMRYARDYAPNNILHTHLQGVLIFSEKFFAMNPIVFADATGRLGLIALLSLVFLWKTRREKNSYCSLAYVLIAVYLLLFVPVWFPALLKKFSYLLIRFEFAAPSMLLSGFLLAVLVRSLTGKPSGRESIISRRAAVLGLVIVAAIVASPLARTPERAASSLRNPRPVQGTSFRDLEDLFSFIEKNIEAGNTVASDPVTSYGIPAFSDCYAVVPLDQHATPNDSTAARRIADSRRALRPWTSPEAIARYLESYSARYLVLNGRIARAVGTMYWRPSREVTDSIASTLRNCPAFVERFASNSVYLFEYDAREMDSCNWTSMEPTFMGSPVESLASASLLDSGEPCVGIDKVEFSRDRIARGDTVTVKVVWVAKGICPFRSYIAYLRFDTDFPRKALFNPAWAKPYRKILEKLSGRRCRFRVDFQPLEGLFPPDEWPCMKRMSDRVTFTVPRDIAPGLYTVFLRLAEKPQYPNYVLADIFTDHDFYRGSEVGSIRIE